MAKDSANGLQRRSGAQHGRRGRMAKAADAFERGFSTPARRKARSTMYEIEEDVVNGR